MLSEYILHIHQDDASRWYFTIASRYRSVESLKIALIRRTDVFVRLSTVFYHSACVRFVFVKECGIYFLVYPDQTSPIPSFHHFFRGSCCICCCFVFVHSTMWWCSRCSSASNAPSAKQFVCMCVMAMPRFLWRACASAHKTFLRWVRVVNKSRINKSPGCARDWAMWWCGNVVMVVGGGGDCVGARSTIRFRNYSELVYWYSMLWRCWPCVMLSQLTQ